MHALTEAALADKPRELNAFEQHIRNAWGHSREMMYMALRAWLTNYGVTDKLAEAWAIIRDFCENGGDPIDAFNKIREEIVREKDSF